MGTKKQLRICIDNTSFFPIVGGTETYCYQLLNAIPPDIASMLLLCEIPETGPDQINNHSIVRLGRISTVSGYDDSYEIDKKYGLEKTIRNSTEASISLAKIADNGFGDYYKELSKFQPDILIINDIMRAVCAPYLQLAPFLTNTSLIINFHGILTSFTEFWEEIPSKKRLVIDFIKNYPNKLYFIAPSKYVYDAALNWGVSEENLRHIYIGVDTNVFTPVSAKDKQTARSIIASNLKLPSFESDELIIGFPSRAVDHKGIDVAVKALSEVSKKDGRNKFRLLIAGGSSDNPESIVDVHKFLEHSGISDRVILGTDLFVNYPGSMISFYRACDLCLFPSRRDALGYGAIESMACGIPVIGTSIPGLCEAMGIEENEEGDCPGGWAIKNENSRNLAAQINSILDNPSVLHPKGQVAREWVKKKFALTKMIEKHRKLFDLATSP